MKLQKNKLDRRFIIKYTVLFMIMCAGVFMQFLMDGKGLVWRTDGASQYVPYLHYMGNFLRDTLEGFLKGDFSLKMYDFAIGMGDDVNAIVRFHPLDFLSAVIPGRYTEILYTFLVLLRLYLAGLSFSVFCFYWKKEQNAVLVGCIVYIFNGYVLIYGMRHPTFNAPLIILPLLLIGAEQVMRKQNGLLFAFMTALGFISNYYFMYMCSIAMACYVLLRFFNLYKEKRIRNFFAMGIRLAGWYLLGVGMISVILFPTVMRLLSSVRLGGNEQSSMLIYDTLLRYYGWFMDLISPYRDTGANTSLNYAVIAVPVLVVLFVRKWKDHLTLKLALILQIVGILVPACAFIMSGFSGITNRWIFIFSFTLSFAAVTVIKDFAVMTKKQIVTLICVAAVYCGMWIVFAKEKSSVRYWKYGVAQLLICVAILLLCRWRSVLRKYIPASLLIMTGISCMVNSFYTYSNEYGEIISQYLDKGTALEYFEDSHFKRYNKIKDTAFYRVDGNTVFSGKENGAIILGYNGISMYNSIINGKLIEYMVDLESPGINAIHRVFSMDGRAVPETLANIKYYLSKEDKAGDVPYGFAVNEEYSGENYKIYENEHALGIGYSYDTYISRSDYEALDALEKQQIMLEAVVLEEKEEETISLNRVSNGKDEIVTVPVVMPSKGQDVKKTKTGYKAEKADGSITITYERRKGYEAYLHFKGFHRNDAYTSVDVCTSDMEKQVMLRSVVGRYSLGRKDYLVNMGYCYEDREDTADIVFSEKGKYDLESIEICYVPLDKYETNIKKLSEDILQNVQEDTNTISGTVSLEKEKYMVFSIPYSEGWKAYVDGKETKLQKANVMYMGLALEPGEHEITLRYCSPGFWPGLTLTLVSVIVFLIFLYKWIKNYQLRASMVNASCSKEMV